MSSFSHPAGITTLHRLNPDSWPALEHRLAALAENCPVTLILPCHARELGTEALAGMIQQLSGARWIRRVIVGLDGAENGAASTARSLFGNLPQDLLLLDTESTAVREIETAMQSAGLTTADSGKGRNVWLCAGLALALNQGPGVVAIHDCDIKNYSRELAGRLCHPLLEPRLGFRYNKGFYSRHSDRLHGRLQRLLVRPLLKAMELRAGPVAMLQFLSAFRYPLAGESALDSALLRQINLPATWGLEIGMLEEVRRHLVPRLVCQTELCSAYDHKHHELSPDDPENGLHRMAREVSATLLATVSGGTYPWREEILPTWLELSADALRHGELETMINGLNHFPEDEALAVKTFATALQSALEEPRPPLLLPSWASVERVAPRGLKSLLEAAGRKL